MVVLSRFALGRAVSALPTRSLVEAKLAARIRRCAMHARQIGLSPSRRRGKAEAAGLAVRRVDRRALLDEGSEALLRVHRVEQLAELARLGLERARRHV